MKRNLRLLSIHVHSVHAVAAVIAVTCFSYGGAVQAQAMQEARALSELEWAFWLCDYTATTRRVDRETAMACGAINDDLKARKFGGDFDALLAWWRLNKETMHRDLEVAARTAAKARGLASSGAGTL